MLKSSRLRNNLLCGLGAAVLLACGGNVCAAASGSKATGSAQSNYAAPAAEAIEVLQGWYDPATGLYRKPTDWWNSANAITVLVDYSRTAKTKQYAGAVKNTFDKASKTYHVTNFVNDANDDEGWWALAWIDAYDMTKTPAYLTMAETIFADMTTQWDTKTCGGGIWWSKDLKNSAYKNAITNELFLSIAASLANRASDPTKKAQYLDWAHKEWRWFSASGMINSGNLVNDGLNAKVPTACVNNQQTTWTYNQGVILGALVELDRADHNPALLAKAQAIAEATMSHLVTAAGVLEEPPGHGPDWPQFKGVFMRNLAQLNAAAPKARYKAFAETNADSILRNDQDSGHRFGQLWQGPFDSGDGTRQTSALDALIAAMRMK
jgi:predicted alpha-1,6-mannanase (GH76 family)